MFCAFSSKFGGLPPSHVKVNTKIVTTYWRQTFDFSHYLIRIRNKYSRHIKPRPVQRGPLAQLLYDLHHDPLSVALVTRLVGLGQVESHSLRVLGAQRLNDVQGAFTQGLKRQFL